MPKIKTAHNADWFELKLARNSFIAVLSECQYPPVERRELALDKHIIAVSNLTGILVANGTE
tara:strand:- start:303 stop:488 length:186 start_codon:yes stop_codon:yes gene_type:complete